MPQSRAVLERQLKLAEQTLAQRVQEIGKLRQEADACARDPLWRSANAVCSGLRRRLSAVAAVEANNAEVTRRKLEPKPVEEKAAAKPAGKPKAEKTKGDKPKDDKPKAEKGDKPEKAEKGKGDKAKAAK